MNSIFDYFYVLTSPHLVEKLGGLYQWYFLFGENRGGEITRQIYFQTLKEKFKEITQESVHTQVGSY